MKVRNWDAPARLAGAALVGAALCALVWTAVAPDRSATLPTAGNSQQSRDEAGRYTPHERGLAWLESLELSSACLAPVKLAAHVQKSNSAPLLAAHRFQCCAQCHSPAAAENTPPHAIGAAARSCSACHKLALWMGPPQAASGPELLAAASCNAAGV